MRYRQSGGSAHPLPNQMRGANRRLRFFFVYETLGSRWSPAGGGSRKSLAIIAHYDTFGSHRY